MSHIPFDVSWITPLCGLWLLWRAGGWRRLAWWRRLGWVLTTVFWTITSIGVWGVLFTILGLVGFLLCCVRDVRRDDDDDDWRGGWPIRVRVTFPGLVPRWRARLA
jgi:hypothetical protein